jgi:hypothetical protein
VKLDPNPLSIQLKGKRQMLKRVTNRQQFAQKAQRKKRLLKDLNLQSNQSREKKQRKNQQKKLKMLLKDLRVPRRKKPNLKRNQFQLMLRSQNPKMKIDQHLPRNQKLKKSLQLKNLKILNSL